MAERKELSQWKIFLIFSLVCGVALFCLVFIPWDIPEPDLSELEIPRETVPDEDNAYYWLMEADKVSVSDFYDSH